MLRFAVLLGIAVSPLLQFAQSPTPQTSNLGFTYHVPSEWEPVDAQSSLAELKEQKAQNAKTETERKAISCVQIPVSARRGNPPSFMTAMALPLDCFGQPMTEKDLPGFAEGGSEGLRAMFDLEEPTIGSYVLGPHAMWIERAKGSPKGHPEIGYTLEITCSLLKESAVCWMAMAANDQALKGFEGSAVTLDGDFYPELIPATAFEKAPAR